MKIWIKDLFSAIWAWLTVWFVPAKKAKRRWYFVVTSSDNPKHYSSFPRNMWLKAYELRLGWNKDTKFYKEDLPDFLKNTNT